MIDKHELRIGNYIMDVSAPGTSIRQIAALGFTKAIYDNGINSSYLTIKPIPLNEKWLYKMGFSFDKDAVSKQGEYGWQIDIGGEGCEFSFNKKGLYNSEDYHERVFRDVHTFQNYYFALTGKELEISLT